YTGRGRRDRPHTSLLFSPRETHFPAERSTPEAPARIPRADVAPRRPRDPQAPPRQGAQASLGLSRVETPPPPFPLTRLRRRLPAWALHGHALPRSLRVSSRGGRRGGPAARPGGFAPARRRRRAEAGPGGARAPAWGFRPSGEVPASGTGSSGGSEPPSSRSRAIFLPGTTTC